MSLRVNIEQVQRQIKEIKATIEELNTQITALTQIRQEVRNSWRGEAAEEFEKQIDALLMDVKQTRQRMDNLIGTIERTVLQIQSEDRVLEDLVGKFW